MPRSPGASANRELGSEFDCVHGPNQSPRATVVSPAWKSVPRRGPTIQLTAHAQRRLQRRRAAAAKQETDPGAQRLPLLRSRAVVAKGTLIPTPTSTSLALASSCCQGR